jgi:hypothetical protein
VFPVTSKLPRRKYRVKSKAKTRRDFGARFTTEQIVELRTRRAAGESLKDLAKAFNTIPEYVNCIATGKTHARVGGPITRKVHVPASERLLEIEGVTLLEREWAQRVGLTPYLLRSRLSRGWAIKDALSTPVKTPPSEILIPPGPSIAYIALTGGHFACIDVDVIPLVKDRPWHTAKVPKLGKAYPATHSNVDGKLESFSLSSVVLGGKPTTTYAVNGNNLDCRRANLRDVSKAQSSWRSARRTDNKTGVTGVYWIKDKQRYIAKLVTNGVMNYIGSFKTVEDAAAAINQAALRLRGEFANRQIEETASGPDS